MTSLNNGPISVRAFVTRSKKGISPVIAAIVLVSVAVVLAVSHFLFSYLFFGS
ncbi:MAG: archaellin/type IV pilin N-terminal domain-containing protein [Nitrososphaerales archaeon]